MASRYQVFRRVVAPIALIVALGVLAWDTCRKDERADVRFAMDFGDDAADIRQVRVDLWVGDDSIGYFETRFGDAGATAPVRWKQPVPRDEIDATVSLTLADGQVVELRRRLHAPSGGEAVIDARVPGR